MIKTWACILTTVILTAFDQLTKYFAVLHLKETSGVPLISGVFELYYLENTGAAWGLFGGMKWLFLILTALISALIMYSWIKIPNTAKYTAFRILSSILAAGAIGNALDRVFRGFVVDFFYFSLIDFPVFNVADCFVCVSLILILIIYRNEDFSWMKKS
ncbi:MAG: signal peptidase II [Eubacteriales bacterium]|nr:signal peptidase II [Eubacteriales bacterium]